MQFLQPGFLWALTLLAIPIIIHLFHFRRFKKVYFTNVAFLKEVKEEVSARSKLRNLLVLLMRLLALTALVLAFAQPILREDGSQAEGPGRMAIILDNSFSMNSEYQDVNLLDRAKNRSLEIIESLPETYRYMLMTNDMEPKHMQFLSGEEISTYIEEIELSPRPFDWQVMKNKSERLLKETDSDNLSVFVFSDFALGEEKLETGMDSTIQYNLVPFRGVEEKNVALDSAWFFRPAQSLGQEVQIITKVVNYSTQEINNIRLDLALNGTQRPVANFSLEAGETRLDTARFIPKKAGWSSAVLSITDYPVQFDDKYYLSFNIPETLKTLVIHDSSPDKYLAAALESSPSISMDITRSTAVPYSRLEENALIVLQEIDSYSSGLQSELSDYVASGGQLFFIPAAEGNLNSYNALLGEMQSGQLEPFRANENQVLRIESGESLFEGVFTKISKNIALPKTKGRYEVSSGLPRSSRSVLRYRDGKPFLYRKSYGDGNVYVLLSPIDLEYSDLVGNAAIFVPMLYNMAIRSISKSSYQFSIGEDASFTLPATGANKDPVYTLKASDTELIPRYEKIAGRGTILIGDEIEKAGIYNLYNKENLVLRISGNYDRSESNLQSVQRERLLALFGEDKVFADGNMDGKFGREILEIREGKSLWKWCIIFALIFLALESIILRIWKK